VENILSLILGGGRGARLYPLTKYRSKPAVPIAGKYRLIDIPVSNCINSGLNRIYVLTQYLSVSLHRHISSTYKFDPFSRGFVEILAAQQTNETADWYQGAADAVRQNRRYILEDPGREVLILAGDQLYRIDFRQLLRTHRDYRADVTIAVLPVPRSQTPGLGIVRLDDSGRVIDFVEKPQTDEQLEPMRTAEEWLERKGLAARGRPFLASMGIYLFNRTILFDLLDAQPRTTSFGREILPASIHTHRVQAHLFDGYWENVSTLRAYHQANLALAGDHPPFDFHSPEGVVYTHMRNLPASRISAAHVEKCLISDGCVVEPGTRLERCVIGVRSRIGRNVTLRDTILLGANYFEPDRPAGGGKRDPPLGVGDDSILERVIADKNCRIGRGVQIVNCRHLQEGAGDHYVIRDGMVVIPNGAVIPDGTVI
jgi:glucose-1-phosphate adenylyltransferase